MQELRVAAAFLIGRGFNFIRWVAANKEGLLRIGSNIELSLHKIKYVFLGGLCVRTPLTCSEIGFLSWFETTSTEQRWSMPARCFNH
jgi:hypothetical protein